MTNFALEAGDLATLDTTFFGKVPVKVIAIHQPDGEKRLTTKADYVVTAYKNRFYHRGMRGTVSPFFLSRR